MQVLADWSLGKSYQQCVAHGPEPERQPQGERRMAVANLPIPALGIGVFKQGSKSRCEPS